MIPELESAFLGHAPILEGFRQCVARGRLGSSYLFVGPPGVGKKTLALRLAQGLLCTNAASPVDPCQKCAECQRIRAESHPDVLVIERPRDRAFIPLELLVGDRDHRSTEGFAIGFPFRPNQTATRSASLMMLTISTQKVPIAS